jgi:hypothetical protein
MRGGQSASAPSLRRVPLVTCFLPLFTVVKPLHCSYWLVYELLLSASVLGSVMVCEAHDISQCAISSTANGVDAAWMLPC